MPSRRLDIYMVGSHKCTVAHFIIASSAMNMNIKE